MSDTESNKARVEALYAALNARDSAAAMACYTPDATITVYMAGPFAGEQPASRKGIEMLFEVLPELRFTIVGLVAEGDRVAAEIRSVGKLADGSAYANTYHNLFELSGGRICRFREYPTNFADAD